MDWERCCNTIEYYYISIINGQQEIIMKSFSEKKCNQIITFILNQFNIQYLKTDLKTVFLDHENLRIVVLNTYYIDEVLFNKKCFNIF